MFVNPAPWTCGTGDSGCNTVESQGGGDTLYETDYNLVNTVLGTSVAYKVGTTITSNYWIASRRYLYNSATDYRWSGRWVSTSGEHGSNYLYRYSSSGFSTSSSVIAIRPIVTLKSGLSYYGVGSKDYPMEIVG